MAIVNKIMFEDVEQGFTKEYLQKLEYKILSKTTDSDRSAGNVIFADGNHFVFASHSTDVDNNVRLYPLYQLREKSNIIRPN